MPKNYKNKYREEFWNIFEESLEKSEVFKRDFTFNHYLSSKDVFKNQYKNFIYKLFSKNVEDKYRDYAIEFKKKIRELNKNLSPEDRIINANSFFKFAKKVRSMDINDHRSARLKNNERVIVDMMGSTPVYAGGEVPEEEPTMTTSDTKKTEVKKESTWKKVKNFFGKIPASFKVVGGISLLSYGALSALGAYIGTWPPVVFNVITGLSLAGPIIIGGYYATKAVYKAYKNRKTKESVKPTETKEIKPTKSTDKTYVLSKRKVLSATREKPEFRKTSKDFDEEFGLPGTPEFKPAEPIHEETSVPDEEFSLPGTSEFKPVEPIHEERPKVIYLPGSIAPDMKPTDSKEVKLDEAVDLPETPEVKEVKPEIDDDLPEIGHKPKHIAKSSDINEELKEIEHKPRHMAKTISEEEQKEINILNEKLKNLKWQKQILERKEILSKTKEELEHATRAKEVCNESIRKTKAKLRKLGVVEETSLSQTLRKKARQLIQKREEAISEEKIDVADSYNHVVNEINKYLELEKEAKRIVQKFGEDSKEAIDFNKKLEETAEKVQYMAFSVEDAYNYESGRSR